MLEQIRMANRKQASIAIGAVVAIALSLALDASVDVTTQFYGIPLSQWPLIFVLVLGGIPLVAGLVGKLVRGEFGSDLLAGISIVTSAILEEYLAGSGGPRHRRSAVRHRHWPYRRNSGDYLLQQIHVGGEPAGPAPGGVCR